MDGVKILSEEMIRDLSNFELAILIVLTVIALILITSITLTAIKPSKQAKIAVILFAILLTSILGAICQNAYNDIHIEYTVQVDDSASFNEFMETYKIIKEKEDNVYVVRLRD